MILVTCRCLITAVIQLQYSRDSVRFRMCKNSPRCPIFPDMPSFSARSFAQPAAAPRDYSCVARTASTGRASPSAPQFLLFDKIEWSADFDNVYLAKNDHRWVTFISLKTIAPGVFRSPARWGKQQRRQARAHFWIRAR